MIEELILKQVADQKIYLATSYKLNVWDCNHEAIVKINNIKYENLLQDKDFINFVEMSNKFLTNSNIDGSIYDQFGHKFLVNREINSTSIKKYNSQFLYNRIFLHLDKYFLSEYMENYSIDKILSGETVHVLVSRAIVTDLKNNQHEKSFINSYIPMINFYGGEKKIEGILKITTDVTEQWSNITYLEKRIFFTFIIVFVFFFIIIIYNTNSAQKIINKQFETNKELKEEKIKAETENSAKTNFLANISHELRTPLNSIIGFSEIILSETCGKIKNLQYQSYINDINNSGKHLLSVINDILDFSKASANKLRIDKMEINLNKVASASIRFFKPRAEAASIKLITDIPTECIVIHADPKRLKQALLNLLSNAIKFTPNGGSVTLAVKINKPKKIVSVIVSDTGIGISDQNIPKALSSFGQVDNKLSRRYDGTGLGLPLTKKLIELMGGELDIHSIKEEGTMVNINFKYNQML